MTKGPEPVLAVHATGLVFEGRGLLLRGPSGSGKSLLALYLLEIAEPSIGPSALVADDLLHVSVENDGLVFQSPEANRGLVELRFFGLVQRPWIERSRLDLVVDFVADLPRQPLPEDQRTRLLDHAVPRVALRGHPALDLAHQALLVRAALADLDRDLVKSGH
ncbi:MAG: aldolase [Hyphomicrobiaceae bacterium]|nr:aldolase [Hyphomicrobiaceae bacterium]